MTLVRVVWINQYRQLDIDVANKDILKFLVIGALVRFFCVLFVALFMCEYLFLLGFQNTC